MPGIEKLHLEEAFEDSPQTRSLLGVFEEDAMKLKKYSIGLHHCCQRILTAQKEMSFATQSLSSHLKAYNDQRFPLENEDSILSQTLQQFTGFLDELSTVHSVLATQLGDGMMYPLNKFLQADLDEISTMCEMYQLSSNEHEQAISRYMKFSKKKENDSKARYEAIEDLYVYRKKFHQTSLHYYSALNALQYKRKTSMLEPLLGYMQSVKASYEMGKETVAKDEVDAFLANISASVQGVHRELGEETQKTVEVIETIEKNSQHNYHPEPVGDAPPSQPLTDLAQKAGFLFLRSKQALLASKWDRCYFFIQGGNLMCQHKDEVAGSLVLDLNESKVKIEPTDTDDRRHVFQIVSPTVKKTVVLQAENESDKIEWLCTLNNCVREGGFVKGVPTATKDPRMAAPNGQFGVNTGPVPIPSHPIMDGHSKRSGPPPTPPSTPSDPGFFPDAPISFDITPSQENRTFLSGTKEGPPKIVTPSQTDRRINPFDQSSSAIASDNKTEDSVFSQSFVVRFLGSMRVKTDRGDTLVHETIRQIMAARAIHNVFKMTESHLNVSSTSMRLIDQSNNTVRTEFQLEDISYWAVHSENERLFGFITRTKSQGECSFACHVFECNTSGQEICQAISAATKLAYEELLVKREKLTENKGEDGEQEKDIVEQQKAIEAQILMDNMRKIEEQVAIAESLATDQTDNVQAEQTRLSADGQNNPQAEQPQQTTDSSPASPDLNPPITENRGDGDERKVEGAECESSP